MLVSKRRKQSQESPDMAPLEEWRGVSGDCHGKVRVHNYPTAALKDWNCIWRHPGAGEIRNALARRLMDTRAEKIIPSQSGWLIWAGKRAGFFLLRVTRACWRHSVPVCTNVQECPVILYLLLSSVFHLKLPRQLSVPLQAVNHNEGSFEPAHLPRAVHWGFSTFLVAALLERHRVFS